MWGKRAKQNGNCGHEEGQIFKGLARKASAAAILAFLSLYSANAQMPSAASKATTAEITRVHSEAKKAQELRGIFVSMPSLEAYNRDPNLDKAISKIASTGFNVIEVEVMNTYGSAYYRSKIVPRDKSYFAHFAASDPLTDVIRDSLSHNVKVWAWVHPFTGNKELYRLHPDWFAVDDTGNVSHRYLDFLNSHVRKYTLSMLEELAANYQISGINLDIELPRSMVSYSAKDISLFAKGNKLNGVTVASVTNGRYNAAWNAWTENTLYSFLANCYHELKSEKKIVVSYDVVSNPSYAYYYEDWPQLLKRKSVDVLEPMLYWRDDGYRYTMIKAITENDIWIIKSMRSSAKIMVVLGGSKKMTYDISGNEWRSALSGARQGGSKDVAVFAYECIKQNSVWYSIKKYFSKNSSGMPSEADSKPK